MKDLASSFAATAAVQLANVASGILAARLLLPEGRGELAAVMLWPMLIAALGGFSINAAAGYLVAGEKRPPGEVFAAATAAAVALVPLLAAVGLAVIPWAYGGYAPEIGALARLYLAFVPMSLLTLCYLSILQGRLRFGALNALRALQPIGYVALIGAAAAAGHATVAGFTAASLGANAVTLVLAGATLARLGWVQWRFPPGILRALARYAATVHVGEVIAVVGRRLDQALVALVLPVAELGLYAVALSAGGLIAILVGAMELLAFPKVAAADPAARAEVLGRYVRLTVALAIVAAAVLVPLLPWLVRLLFGAAFLPAVAPARIVAVAMVFHAFRATLSAGLRGTDRALTVGGVEGAALVALAAGLAVLLPRYGIVGGAWALAGSNVVACALLIAAVRRALGIGFARLMTPGAREWELAGALWRRTGPRGRRDDG